MSAPSPVTPEEFARLMAEVSSGQHPFPALAVAVSGGADSMALLRLAAEWARKRNVSVHALTVDHGLRPESAAEARKVARWARGLPGVRHKILLWAGKKPKAGIQDEARRARYALLQGYCAQHRIPVLLTAHHLDDQAETFLLRLHHGSGLKGLCGMAPAQHMTGTGSILPLKEAASVTLLRPLLGVGRGRLVETCRHLGQPWLEDPSNDSLRFGRVRMRHALRQMQETAGITAAAIVASMGKLRQGQAIVDYAIESFLLRHGFVSDAGYVAIPLGAWRALPPELARAVLLRMLADVSGAVYPPRSERLERAFQALFLSSAPVPPRARTLSGCRIVFTPAPCGHPDKAEKTGEGGWILVLREERAIPNLEDWDGGALVWDGRFSCKMGKQIKGLRLAPLGRAGIAAIRKNIKNQSIISALAGIPAPVRPVLPAVWKGKTLLAVPCLGFDAGGGAKCLFLKNFRCQSQGAAEA